MMMLKSVKEEIERKRDLLNIPKGAMRRKRTELEETSGFPNVVELRVWLVGGMQVFFYESRDDPDHNENVPEFCCCSIFGHETTLQKNDSILRPQEGEPARILDLYLQGGVLQLSQSGLDRANPLLVWLPPGRIKPPLFLQEECVESLTVSYGFRDGEDVFYNRSPPSFENICGGITTTNSVHMESIVSMVDKEERSQSSRNILKRSKTAFGICYELFTVHGNIALRRDRNMGGMVSFKGARDVRKVFNVIKETLGDDFVSDCSSSLRRRSDYDEEEYYDDDDDDAIENRRRVAPGRKKIRPNVRRAIVVVDQYGERRVQPLLTRVVVRPALAVPCDYRGFFSVHMAVVTACLGKRLSVYPGNPLETTLHKILGPTAVTSVNSLDDDSNSIKIRVLDWKAVESRSNEIVFGENRNFTTDFYVRDNTISVTSKGSVIIRFSWDTPIQWDDDVCEGIRKTCSHLCNLLRECC